MRDNSIRASVLSQHFRRLNLAALFLISVGCTKTATLRDTIMSHLRDKGPVDVVSDNPFLASSLLLSKEAESSPEMRGFIEHKGSPRAFEVRSAEGGKSTITFYYPDSREEYSFDKVDGAYIISGPFPIEAKKLGEVQNIKSAGSSQPAAARTPETSRTPEIRQPSPKKSSPTEAPSSKPTTAPTEPPAPQQSAPAGETRTGSAPPTGKDSLPALKTGPTPDQGAAIQEIIAKHGGANPAEITSKGDLVHFVTFQGETLSIIARWYTLDLINAPRIARINRLSEPNALKLGDQIIIPSYLVRNKSRLTAPGMQALIESVVPTPAPAEKAD